MEPLGALVLAGPGHALASVEAGVCWWSLGGSRPSLDLFPILLAISPPSLLKGILNARKRVEAKRQRERMEQAKRDAALGFASTPRFRNCAFPLTPPPPLLLLPSPLPIKINAKGMAEADGTYNEIFTAIPMKNFPEPDIGQVMHPFPSFRHFPTPPHPPPSVLSSPGGVR